MGAFINSLQKHFDKIILNENFNNLIELLENTTVKTTCWGDCKIEVKNFSGSLNFDLTVKKIFILVQNFCYLQARPIKDSESGSKIMRKLQALYLIRENEMKNANFFTKFFLKMRCGCLN